MSVRPTLLLVDGSSYLYRAFHAMPDLRNAQGEPTGALHGMISMLERLREQFPASHAVCVFDAKGPTFRHDWYTDYKANRPSMPTDLVAQLAPIHEMVRLMGWPVLEVPGIEADDAIGTLAQVAVAAGYQVVISTGDKDLAQLVNPHVSLVNTMTGETLDEAGVVAKFGVAPDRIIDYLSLIGDTVDNVPGVEKVGPKTAVKWLAEHGSLEGVMAAAASVKGVAGENLRRALDWLPMGRRLITVQCDADLSSYVCGWPQVESLAFKPEDSAALLAFYIRHGFGARRRKLEDEQKKTAQKAAVKAVALAEPDLFAALDEPETVVLDLAKHYETILTEVQLDAWMARILAAELVALDTETDSLDAMQARIIGISLAVKPGEAAYIPVGHDYPGAPEQLDVHVVLARLKPWLEDATALKVGQNIKYDTHVLLNHAITLRGWAHDTMLESYVLEAHRPHGLESLALRHLNRKGLSYEDLCGKGVHQIPFSQVSIEQATTYSGEDSDMTLHVHQTLWPRLQAEPKLCEVYTRIELPTAAVLGRIERHGVLIDASVLLRQSNTLAQRMVILEAEAHAIAGQAFNLSSPKQIGEILFHRLGLPIKKKTATGAPSTDEDVLQELALDYPLPAKLLEYRSLAKIKSTYTDKLPQMVNPATGRVHTNYAQAVAVTGRLASNEPNLQNIPIRTAEGRRVREAFIAPPGHVIVSADYSQIELRIMAHLSNDATLLRAFAEGLDVHRATAAEIFGITPGEVTSEQRRYAKTINFGLIYGMGSFGLAQSLGIDMASSKAYIERYFTRYPDVKRYMDATRAQAAEHGYVETLFGRRIELMDIRGGSGPRRAAAERQAINAPMQGTAADLIKLAMLAVQDAIDTEGRASRLIMQVHDELVLEVPEAELDWAREALPRWMAGVAELKVPLLAEVGVGSNWEQAH
jgi:DNA polymerase-1